MRIITWNVRRASTYSPAWDYLLELDPDIALIQDSFVVPEKVREIYSVVRDQTVYYPRERNQHASAILAKGKIGPFMPLPAPNWWMKWALAEWREYFTTRKITLENGVTINAMSVYSHAVPVPRHHWAEQDTEGIQLPENKDLWATELMWSVLRLMPSIATEPWIVGGDLNTSISFDIPRPRGNQRILDRMAEIGLPNITTCESRAEIPTFRHPRGRFEQQLDYLFANDMLSRHLESIGVGDEERVFKPRPMLSDHLPLIADFDLMA